MSTSADFNSLFRRAWMAQTSGEIDEALAIYRKILGAGDNASAWLGMGQCHLARKDRGAALQAFRKALELMPQSGAIRHMVDMLDGSHVPDRAPDDYVLWVFDGHAETFDAHLAALNYQGPQMIAGLVAGIWPDAATRTILDLGCGTGLNAPLFRGYSSRLDGVDLAPQMLQQAVRRGGYDNLYKAEIHAFLDRPPIRYDAILSTDVFIYIGRLEKVFSKSRQCLNPGGELLCTIELGADDSPPVALMPSGRFRQSDAYIRATASATGFRVLATQDGPLRHEDGNIEPGRAYRLVRV